jgi:hypothetical protein
MHIQKCDVCPFIEKSATLFQDKADKALSMNELKQVRQHACFFFPKHAIIIVLMIAHVIHLPACSSMLTFASDYGHEAEVLADAQARPGEYAFLGPTRTTSMLVSIPAFVSDKGDAITVAGAAEAMARAGASIGAAGHIDVDKVNAIKFVV